MHKVFDPARQDAFLAMMKGITLGDIGQVTKGKALVVTGLKGQKIIKGDIYQLKAAWQRLLGAWGVFVSAICCSSSTRSGGLWGPY